MISPTELASPAASAPTQRPLGALLEGRPLNTIDDVLATMALIDATLGEGDGLKWFNTLYAMVTERIKQEILRGKFAKPVWVERLDVVFARLYFEAIVADEHDPRKAPRAWRPLFQARFDRSIARLQYALAGMNAHINHDLAIAVVETCAAMQTEPTRGCPEHADYLEVNDVLEDAEKTATGALTTGLIREAEQALGRVDNIIAMWSVKKARDAAWTNAEVLWALRGNELLYETFVGTMDRMAGFAGRGMLIPIGLGEAR